VLGVDDNDDAAATLGMLLALWAHEVRTAHDGLAAVAQAEELRPDMILLDIGLPTIDGYETCRRIRSQAWARDVVIVALTGWGQDEDRRRSQDAGFDHHLVKPVDTMYLARLLASPVRR
jgi:CheY-like chemotaxis protein